MNGHLGWRLWNVKPLRNLVYRLRWKFSKLWKAFSSITRLWMKRYFMLLYQIPLYCYFLTEQSLIYEGLFYDRNYIHERKFKSIFIWIASNLLVAVCEKCTNRQTKEIYYLNYTVITTYLIYFYFIISVIHDSDNKRLHEWSLVLIYYAFE